MGVVARSDGMDERDFLIYERQRNSLARSTFSCTEEQG